VSAILALGLTCFAQSHQVVNTNSTSPARVIQPAAQDSDSSQVRASQPLLQQRNPRYQLETDDTLLLSFEFTPDFNQTITVQPDGYITLRGIGDVHVEGYTVPQLTELLRASYSKILEEPAIAVVLKDFEKPYFVAGGQVGHPGKYELRGDFTVTQAIAMAGGFLTTAKHSQVLLFRRASADWMEARVLNVKKMFSDGNLSEDVHLQPGDMIFVPQNRISKVERFLPIPHGMVNFDPTQF